MISEQGACGRREAPKERVVSRCVGLEAFTRIVRQVYSGDLDAAFCSHLRRFHSRAAQSQEGLLEPNLPAYETL